jgi:hypothetical protein
MANHASTRTTQLYDRRRDEVSLDEGRADRDLMTVLVVISGAGTYNDRREAYMDKVVDVLKSIPNIIIAASQSPLAFWVTIIIGVLGLSFLIAYSLRGNPSFSLASLVITVASVIFLATLGARNMRIRADPTFSTDESSQWWLIAKDHLYTVSLDPKDNNHMEGRMQVVLQPKTDKEVYGQHLVDLTYDPSSKSVDIIRHMPNNADDHFTGKLVSDNTFAGSYSYKSQVGFHFAMYRQY